MLGSTASRPHTGAAEVISVATAEEQVRPTAGAVLDAVPAFEGGPAVRQSGRFGWVFSCIWLVYLWYPLEAAWDDPDPVWRALGLAGTLAFAGLFAWFFVTWRARRLAGLPLTNGQVLRGLVVGVGLLALA